MRAWNSLGHAHAGRVNPPPRVLSTPRVFLRFHLARPLTRPRTYWPRGMIAFLRRLWGFVRPYKGRLIVGAVCGACFAVANGALIIAIKVVVNLIFSGDTPRALTEDLAKLPAVVRPLTNLLIEWLPALKAPSSNTGVVLVVATIPAIMFVRGLAGYFNVYLMTWVGARAVADLRTRVFEHLQNLSLAFFDQARTGDLISRILNDTQVLYGIVANSFSSLVKDPLTVAVLIGV